MLASLLRRLLRGGKIRAPESAPHARGGADNSTAGWLTEALRLREQERHRELVALCRSVLAREPDNTDALNFMAAARLAQGDSREGVACLRRVTELAPDSAQTWASLAAVLAATGDVAGAIDGYGRATRLRPDFSDAWLSLASGLKALGRYDEAEQCCRSALPGSTQPAAMRHLLGMVMFEQGRLENAIAEIRAALALDPGSAAAGSDLLRLLNYSDTQDPAAVYEEHRAWANRFARPLELAAPPHHNDPDPARKLRIGYVSPYLQKHAVTFFLSPR